MIHPARGQAMCCANRSTCRVRSTKYPICSLILRWLANLIFESDFAGSELNEGILARNYVLPNPSWLFETRL